jgi:hypothetical protein
MIFLFFMETSRDSDFWHCGSNADVPVVVKESKKRDSDKVQLRTDVKKCFQKWLRKRRREAVEKRLNSS